MLISCQYMFAKQTKIDWAKERTLVWKNSDLERRNFVRQVKFSAQKWTVIKRQQQKSFSSLCCLLIMWVNICITEDLPTSSLLHTVLQRSGEIIFLLISKAPPSSGGDVMYIHEIIKEQWTVTGADACSRARWGRCDGTSPEEKAPSCLRSVGPPSPFLRTYLRSLPLLSSQMVTAFGGPRETAFLTCLCFSVCFSHCSCVWSMRAFSASCHHLSLFFFLYTFQVSNG